MGRGTVVATVLAALLAGSGVGVGLHAWRPDPFGRDHSATTGPSTGPSTGSGTGPDGPSTASPSASPSATGSATPSGPPDASGSAGTPTANPTETGPSFTRLALLQPPEFVQYGWEVAQVTYGYPALPDEAITPCSTITAHDPGVQEGYAATYTSNHTVAQELVARYADEQAAKVAYGKILNAITNCGDPSVATSGKVVAISSFARSPKASGVSAIRWWNTRGATDKNVKGVIGAVRSADRIALVNLSSDYSNPDGTHEGGTTEIDQLMAQAGRRLV